MTERIINAERIEQIINVFGSFDENIKRIEETYHVKITNRGTELKVSGGEEEVDKGARAIEGLLTLAAKGETTILNAESVDRGYEAVDRELTALGAAIRRL